MTDQYERMNEEPPEKKEEVKSEAQIKKEAQLKRGTDLMKMIVQMINGEGLFTSAEEPDQIAQGIDVLIEQPLEENEKPAVIDEFAVKWGENDSKIKNYFEHSTSALPLNYFDVITNVDLSYKLSDIKIVIFDKRDNTLKIFNTLEQEVNKIEQRKYCKIITVKKSLQEIVNFNISAQRRLSKIKVVVEDFFETATRVIPSADGRDILLGTSYGKLLIIDVKDLRTKQVFKNIQQTAVVDIIQKQNFIAIGYENGEVIVYKRSLAFQSYSMIKLQEEDGVVMGGIKALKLSKLSKYFCVIQEIKKEDEQEGAIKNSQIAENFYFKVILYDLKKLYEIGRTEIITTKIQNFQLKNYIDINEKFLLIRSDNMKSFDVYSLDDFEQVCQAPDNIDPSHLQLIYCLPENQVVLLVSQMGECYYYDTTGKVVDKDKHHNTISYIVAPFGNSDSKLVSLSDCILLCNFKKKIYSQVVLLNATDQILYFASEKESFIIQFGAIKATFKGIISAKISQDSKVFAHVYHSQNTKFMDLTDMKTQNVLKTFKQFEPITSTFDNQFFICQDLITKYIYKINLQSMELDYIEDVDTQMLCASKFDYYMFYRYFDEENKKYKLALYDIYKKVIISQLELDFDSEFFFQLSNNERYIIISTKEGKLIKICCRRPRSLKVLSIINHEPGYCTHISFDEKDLQFLAGGSQTGNVNMYNLSTMKLIRTIDNHIGANTYGYFVEEDRLVTKNDDKLIYWRWNKHLQLLFTVLDKLEIVQGYNRTLAGIVMNNEISLWSEYLTHALTFNTLNIQPNTLKKEWTIGPLIYVYPFIINYFIDAPEEHKLKMLPHLLKYVVLPHGFTLLSKLVYTNQKVLVKEACKIQNQRYIRDINGNTPLMYALKKKDYETIDQLLEFLSKDSTLLNRISFAAMVALIEVCPSLLITFLESTVVTISKNMNELGQKKNEYDQTYYEFDPQERLKPDKIYEKLFNLNASETEMIPIIFKQTQLSLNVELGSRESILFAEALADCPNEGVFRTTFVKNLLAHKWSKMKTFANCLLFLTVFFTATISLHSFSPGQKIYIDLLKAQNYFWAGIEFIIYWQSGFRFKYNGGINLALFVVLNIYCFYTLDSSSPTIDNLLPLINWMAWFQMILQIQQFEMIRTFVSIFLACLQSLTGFNYFLVLMIFTFATTQDIIQKNMARHKLFPKEKQEYSRDFYKDIGALQDQSQNLLELWDCIFDTWISIIKGDFNDNEGTVWRFYVYISTFISTVVLLNLIIAFMSDSYAQVMITIEEKKNKTLNFMTLRLEKVLFWKKNSGKKSLIVWSDYASGAFTSFQQKSEISEIIHKEVLKSYDYFERICKYLVYDLKLLIIQSRQQLTNTIKAQEFQLDRQIHIIFAAIVKGFDESKKNNNQILKVEEQKHINRPIKLQPIMKLIEIKPLPEPEFEAPEILPVRMNEEQLTKMQWIIEDQFSVYQKLQQSINKRCNETINSMAQGLKQMIFDSQREDLKTPTPVKKVEFKEVNETSKVDVNKQLRQIENDFTQQVKDNQIQISTLIDQKVSKLKKEITFELLQHVKKSTLITYGQVEKEMSIILEDKIQFIKQGQSLSSQKNQQQFDQLQKQQDEIRKQLAQLVNLLRK